VNRILHVPALIGVLWVVLAAMADAQVSVRDGPEISRIVLPEDAGVAEKAAAAELQSYLSRIAGKSLPVGTGGEIEGAILVGCADRLSDVGISVPLLGPDSFLVRVAPGAVHLVGQNDRAVWYAVYDFLEDLGCRWVMPGDTGEVVPNLETITLEPGERVEAPDFEFRQIWYAYGSSPEAAERLRVWGLRNKLGHPLIHHGHNLVATLPPGKYLADHPEYYALVAGERNTTQLCTSNPDVVRLVSERIGDYFDAHPEVLSYSLCPDDNTDFCECQNCRALDLGGTDPFTGKQVVTDRYVRFLNEVSSAIQGRHPGKMVTTYAYVNYTRPPEREPVGPHVAVVLTTSVFCAAHGIGDGSCESRQEMKRLLGDWLTAASRVYIYDYDPTPFNAELPCPLFGARTRDMPVYKQLGVRGFSFESHNSWATLFPNYYVAAKMMWDADQDAEALLDDLWSRFYGESAEPMGRYFTALEKAYSSYSANVNWGMTDLEHLFTAPVLNECAKAIDDARKNCKSQLTKKRVELAATAFEYLRQYIHAKRIATADTSLDEFERAKSRCYELVDALHNQNEDFILARVAKDYLDSSLGQIAGEKFAKSLGLVTEWMLIGPFDNTARRGHGLAYPPEKEIDLSGEYDGVSGNVKWRHHKNPRWRGYIDLASLMEPKDWVCAYALCYVESPEEMNVQLRVGSNDSVVVWLAGKKVWDNKVDRTARLDDDIVPVTLPKGVVPVLLKIGQTGVNWGFYFRITDHNGNRVPQLKFSTSPPKNAIM